MRYILWTILAYLLIMNYFGWDDTLQWKIIRWGMAIILGCYGLYRCYRQITGTDYYRSNDLESRSQSWSKETDKNEEECKRF